MTANIEATENKPLLPDKAARIKATEAYSHWLLAIYDWWVLGVVTTYAWRCPTTSYLLPFFRKHASLKHLDIGVGTGYYLSNADWPPEATVTLVDLNANSLETAEARLAREGTRTVLQDIFEPLPKKLGNFDSISLFYLMHCLPGSVKEKCQIFGHLKDRLNDGGCVYGATILGAGVKHNIFGRAILTLRNSKGFFTNRDDSEAGFANALRVYFEEVEVELQGTVLMFKGSKPKIA